VETFGLYPTISNCIQLYPTVSNCIQLYPNVSNCIQLYPTVSNRIQLFIRLLVYLFIRRLAYLLIRLFVYLFIRLLAYLFIANSVGGHPKGEQLEGQVFLITCLYNKASLVAANYPRTAESKTRVRRQSFLQSTFTYGIPLGTARRSRL
jgi:hypothetical protein